MTMGKDTLLRAVGFYRQYPDLPVSLKNATPLELVEAAGIEPASEDASAGITTCVAYLLVSRVTGLR
jgi:hypothetical protein